MRKRLKPKDDKRNVKKRQIGLSFSAGSDRISKRSYHFALCIGSFQDDKGGVLSYDR